MIGSTGRAPEIVARLTTRKQIQQDRSGPQRLEAKGTRQFRGIDDIKALAVAFMANAAASRIGMASS
jgi:hypothetical protein